MIYNDTDSNGTQINLTVSPLNYSQNYSWKIHINDSSQGLWINQTFETVLDTNNPTINYINWVQPSDGSSFTLNGSTIDENFIFNVSVSDAESLFSFNITVNDTSEIHLNYYIDFIGATSYNFLNLTNLGDFDQERQDVYVEVCDGHTKEKINIDVMKIAGVTYFDDIKIHADFSTLDTVYMDDRYTFIFDYATPKDDIEIEIESPYEIKDIFYSGHEGHLITGDYWIDFNNNDGFEVYDMIFSFDRKKVTVKMTSETLKDSITFNSIGKINCINQTVFFNVDLIDDTVNLSTPVFNKSYIVNDSNMSILFNYIPYYLPTNPNNCSLYFNSTFQERDLSVTKNTNNTFNRSFTSPLGNTTDYYDWFVRCNHIHFHPPSTYESHVRQSETFTFDIYNIATTTSTTTTTLINFNPNDTVTGFESTGQGLFYIFIAGLWVTLILLYHRLTGRSGRKIGFLIVASVPVGFVLGMELFKFSWLMGMTVLILSGGMLFTIE